MNLYILNELGLPEREPHVCKWSQWMSTHPWERFVGVTHIVDSGVDISVSTIFVGVNCLWETMIFGGEHDLYQERRDTQADAVLAHARIVQALRDGKDPRE